jgi:hypothetical protein
MAYEQYLTSFIVALPLQQFPLCFNGCQSFAATPRDAGGDTKREGICMRMMLRITLPTAEANAALVNGSFEKTMEATIIKLNPEASYFVANGGRRCAMLFFEMKDASEIPAICEPWFMVANAEIELVPAMNLEDLKKGLAAAS